MVSRNKNLVGAVYWGGFFQVAGEWANFQLVQGLPPSPHSLSRENPDIWQKSWNVWNFICESLNICLLKFYLLLTKYFFVFRLLIFYLKKNKLFLVKNTSVFKRIFFANLIFFHFHSLWFLIWKLTTCHCAQETTRDHTPTIELGDLMPYW